MQIDIAFAVSGGILILLAGAALSWFLLRARLRQSENAREASGREYSAAKARMEILEKDLGESETLIAELRTARSSLEIELTEQKTRLESETRRLEEYRQELTRLNEQMSKEFELISSRLMERNTESLARLSKENIHTLLDPFGEKLRSFEGLVRDTYEKGLKERSDLMAQVRQLHETNIRLGEEAQNLTKALKGDAKVRGNWGEVVLERVLERSGLRKGEEYTTQESLRDADSVRYQPDVIVHLPENKHLIIDSKVSLVAYEQHLSEEDEEKREKLLKQHILAVRKHVSDLAAKGYQNLEGIDTPEFVMMFIPIEASFSLTIQSDADLFQDAWQQRIVIVSPSTLLATLRTIASIWRHEKQTRNAIAIAKEGGALVDKLRSTFEVVRKLEGQINTVMKTTQDINTKFDGRGGLLSRANKMQKLGARAKGELSEEDEYQLAEGDTIEDDENDTES